MISWLPAAHIAKRIAEAIGPGGWLHTGDVRARRVPQRGRLTAYEDQVVGRGVRTEFGAMVLDVHLILDNSFTHKTPAIQRWLLAHPRFIMRFTPTSSSWLNLVERWFAELTNEEATPRHTPLGPRAQQRHPRLDQHMEREPTPFVWTKTADEILDSIARYCTRISESQH